MIAMMKKDDDGDGRRGRRDPLSFAACLAGYERHFFLRNYSRKTWRSSYRPTLEELFRFLESEGVRRVSDVTREALRRFQHRIVVEKRPWLGRPFKAATVATWTAAIRSFFRWAEGEALVVDDPSRRLQAPKVPRGLPRGLLSRREAARLLSSPDPTRPLGTRDRAILELLYGTGVRVSELVSLTLADVDEGEHTIRIRGKGGKVRLVPLGRRAFRAVLDYMEGGARELILGRGRASPFVFVSTRQKRMHPSAVLMLVKRHARRAGITKTVTVHGLRHTCGTHLLRGGADIRAVQELLGHRSLGTTERYTHLVTDDLRRAILRHHPRERMGE